MSQRQIHPATGSQSVSMAPRKSMVATPLTNFGSPGQRRNSKENLGIIPFPSGEKDQEGVLRASGQSLKAGMMSAPDVFAAGGGGTEKRNSRESQQGQPAAAQNVRSHRRSSTIESSTGEQLIVAPEEEKYEMRGLLINVFISVLLGVLIGVCGAMFHNAVHMMKIFFRVTLGNLMVDWFDSDAYIFAHMWLGATACIMAVSFITRHMCPECIGGGMVATKICICLSSPIQLQIIAYRFVLSAIYIGGGSPLGIEAPTFHLSAAIASNANRFIEKLDNTILNADTMPQIVLIGCVAGLSQAFNTPIGSLLFVLEEFDFVRRSHITFVMIVACSVPATAVSLYLKKSFNLHSSFLALPPPENLASNDVSLLLLYVYAALIGAITAMFSEMFSEMVLRFRSRFASFVSSFETDDHDENGSKLDGAPGDQEDPQQQPSSSFTEEQARRFSLDTSDDFFKSDSGSATASGFHPASAVDRLSEQGGKPRNSHGGSSSTPTGATPPSSGNTAPAAGQGQGQLPNQPNIPGQMSASSSPTTGHQQLPNQHSHESSIPPLSGGGGGAAAAAGAAAADQKQSSAKGPTSVASTLTGQSSNAPLNHRSTVLQDPQNIVHGQILVASIKNNARKLFHFDKLKPTEKGYFLLNIAAGSVVGLSGILVYNVMRLQINVHCEQWKKSCPDAWGSGEQLLEYLHRKAHQAANRDELDYTTVGAGGATALVRRHLGAASVGAKGELATAGAGGHSSDSQSGLELVGRSYDEEDFPSDRENDVAVTTLAGGGMQVRSTSRTDPGYTRAEVIGGMACTYFVVGFLKMFAVAVCTAAGGSGGMFAPAMIMGGYFGGGLGSLLKWASGPEDPVNGTYLQLCVLFGMVGFFSASHRLPLTGSLCIYELIVASTDEDKTIAGTYIVSRLFFPMLVCSIVSFCLSIYMHPQALLERTMEQDGLHDLCFGSGEDMDGSDPWAVDEDGSDSDSDTESSTEEETADRDGAGTVEGGRQSGSSVKSNEQTNFMSMVSKTLLPPELMQAGKGRRQSVDLAPEDDINDGARGGSSTSGGGSVSGGGKRKPSVKTEDGTDYSEPVLMTDTEREKLKIRRASHPPTAEATNTNARIVEFYRRNSSDLRKEFEALKQSIANPPTSSSSKRSFVPDKNLLKTLHGEERRQNSSKEAPERLQSGAGHRGGGGTGDSASNQADSPPVVQRELSLGAPNFDDFLRPRQQPDDAISVSLSVHRGSAIPRNNWAPHDFGGTGSGGTMNLSSQGSKRNTQSVQPNSQTKRNTKVSSTSTLRILENAMKRRGNAAMVGPAAGPAIAAETASSLSSMTSNSTPDGMINLTNNSLSAMAGGGPGGSANMPRASAAFLRARSGSISTTPGQLWKELRESRAERGPPNLASTSEEDCMSSYQPVLSQRSIGGPKHSLSMTSLGSSQMALATEIVYPSSVPEEEEN
eukprot:g4207.t1